MDIFLPELVTAPLRAGTSLSLVQALNSEQLLFAAHYATVNAFIDWPDVIEARIKAVRTRYESHDQVLKLMESLRGQIPMPVSADLAKRLAEGMEVFSDTQNVPNFYLDLCTTAWERYRKLEAMDNTDGEFDQRERLARFSSLLGLNPIEKRLLVHALLFSVIPAWEVFTRMMHQSSRWRASFWTSMLAASETELGAALSSKGRLASSGVLVAERGLPILSNYWIEVILKKDTSFVEALLQPLQNKSNPDGVSRIPDEDAAILQSMLGSRESGINVLIYGKKGIDKRSIAWTSIQRAGGTPYALSADIPDRERPAAILLGNKLLAEKSYLSMDSTVCDTPTKAQGRAGRAERAAGEHPILVIDQAQSILTRSSSGFLSLFGLADDDEDAKLTDELLLTENNIPTVWLTNDAGQLHRETLAHFLFHVEALRGTRADRLAAVESLISSLPITKVDREALSRLEGLSGQQVQSAKRLAEISGSKRRGDFGRRVVVAATRSQKAMARRTKDEARIPVTQYSLEFINATGRFGPEKILKALSLRPKASVCLYGLPGTGKTQFAEHAASELARPILIKHASQLFDKYVGESEKRIAEAFDEAEEEGAILLLDEADSFLRDRGRSQHQWEVSTVNEVLQRMERFEGIFICTTNLYTQLDIAALRRFTFKLEFLSLTLEQRWAMFLNEAGLRSKPLPEKKQASYEERLMLMRDLTPGDFATVKRQCVLLGESLSPEEWLSQLELEAQAKARASEGNERIRSVA
jgi:hypothetical protein